MKTKISTDFKRAEKAATNYNELCTAMTALWRGTRKIFPEFALVDLFSLSRLPLGAKLDNWLARYYVSANKERFGEFDPDVVIKQQLIKLPDFTIIKDLHAVVFDKLRTDFSHERYPGPRFSLIKFFDADSDAFIFTEESRNEIVEFYSCFVETPAETRVHEAIAEIAKALNRLDGFVQIPGYYSIDKIKFLDQIIEHHQGRWQVKHHALGALGFQQKKEKRKSEKNLFEI
jgi:hypothetical protein